MLRRLAISSKTGSSTLVKLLDAPKIMPVLSVVTVDSLFFKTECKAVSLVLISCPASDEGEVASSSAYSFSE